MIMSTSGRVAANTAPNVNEIIHRQTAENVARFAAAGREAIQQRLAELDAEWDIERCVETVAPILTLTGLGLGLAVNKKWWLLSAVVQGFFLQHAIEGWCPPIPVLRRLGVRTMEEINAERYALKALRGDFEGDRAESGDNSSSIGRAMRAVWR